MRCIIVIKEVFWMQTTQTRDIFLTPSSLPTSHIYLLRFEGNVRKAAMCVIVVTKLATLQLNFSSFLSCPCWYLTIRLKHPHQLCSYFSFFPPSRFPVFPFLLNGEGITAASLRPCLCWNPSINPLPEQYFCIAPKRGDQIFGIAQWNPFKGS